MGRILTKDAQKRREKFEKEFGKDGFCSCWLAKPCPSCTHRGNPINQEEDDDSWQHISTKMFPLEEGGYEVHVQNENGYECLYVSDASELGEAIMVALAKINLRG